MPGYPHLTGSERDRIADMKAQGLGATATGNAIGREKPTISRELRRSALQVGSDRPVYAEGSYRYRHLRKGILEQDKPLPVSCWTAALKVGRPSRSPDGSGAALRSVCGLSAPRRFTRSFSEALGMPGGSGIRHCARARGAKWLISPAERPALGAGRGDQRTRLPTRPISRSGPRPLTRGKMPGFGTVAWGSAGTTVRC